MDAQKRYGTLMETLDVEEDRWHAENLMLLLLDGNRSAWHVNGGRIVFFEAKTEEEFRFYLQPTDGATSWWKKDFGGGGGSPRIFGKKAVVRYISMVEHPMRGRYSSMSMPIW